MTWSANLGARFGSKLWPLLLSSCVGEIGAAGGGTSAGGAVNGELDPAGPGSSAAASCSALGATPLARLARQEYLNTARELFQIEPPAATALPEDADFGGFKTTAGQTLNAPLAEKYVDAAAAIANAVLLQPDGGFGCAGRDENSCVAGFLNEMGPRMFRRPLLDPEIQHYQALFSTTRASGTFEQAASVLLQALLLAPQFLFHIEERAPGQPEGQAYALNDYQLAARLSYLFWRSPPDVELASLAAQGTLHGEAVLRGQVERLLADERARPVVRSFLSQWLRLEKIEGIMVDPVKEPAFTPALLSALSEETRSFVEQTFWSSTDTVRELLVSTTRFRNQELSRFYGDTLGSGDSLTPVTAEPDERAFGLLSQAGFLAAISRNQDAAIIYRGRFVREKLLCGQLALPPANVASPLPQFTPGMTGRQRVAEHTSGPACVSCHQLMNPLGFALEHFDYLGRWRDQDHASPIDANATIDAELGEVSGALGLSHKLSESDLVAACATQQAFEFSVGRTPATEDSCALEALRAEAPRNLRALLAAVPGNRVFQYRVEPKP